MNAISQEYLLQYDFDMHYNLEIQMHIVCNNIHYKQM